MCKRIKNTLIYLAARLLMGVVRRMGLARSQRFGRWLGRRAFGRARTERNRTLAHLELAFPDMSDDARRALARSVFEHFGAAVAECVNARRIGDLGAFVELDEDSRRVLDAALARGHGVVFVTCHCGNWELMARSLAHRGYPVNTIGQKSYDPRFTRLIAGFRERGGVRTIWRGEPGVLEKMAAVCARGEIMGLLIDQDTRVPGVFVPFFGREAYTPTAAALLARRTGAALVCGLNHRKTGGGYRILVEEHVPSANPDERTAVRADTAALTARIERHIRQHPSEWVWMHRRWKTRPENGDDRTVPPRLVHA